MGRLDGEGLWWFKLDFDWCQDPKVVALRAKYGKAVLVDMVNVFALMAKCGGIADLANPVHCEWARVIVGKQGKAMAALVDKLAEFEIVSPDVWSAFGHVTSNRAIKDAGDRARATEARRKQTEAAREARARKRKRESTATEVCNSAL